MLIGYARISKADGSQSLDLQRDALLAASVAEDRIYTDRASGKKDERPGLEACLKALREGDVLVIWKLDRLGRSLHHLVKTVTGLSDCGIGLKVLTGQGAQIDTTTAAGRLSFGISLPRWPSSKASSSANAPWRGCRPPVPAAAKGAGNSPSQRPRSAWPRSPWHVAMRQFPNCARNSVSIPSPSTDMSIQTETCGITGSGF